MPPMFALVFLVLLSAAATPAAADPPGWSGAWQVHERYHRPDDDDIGAPVPFVVAPGGGEEDEDGVPVARGLPYGFNRGTCDHALLGAMAAHGAALGGAFGRGLAGRDRDCLWGALESLPDNRTIVWVGENGTLFQLRTGRTHMKGGTACRDWQGGIGMGPDRTQTFGTFCRRSDGQWVSAQ